MMDVETASWSSGPARIVLIRGLVVIALLFLGCRVLKTALLPDRFRDVVADPGADFTRFTGLSWPRESKVVLVGDDHGGFLGDGEFYLVFETDRTTIERWLSGHPPWNAKAWLDGPVDSEIAGCCWFGRGAETRVEVLQDREIKYVATPRGQHSTSWHNGSLVVLDLKAGRVWLSVWDF